jgi:hypothetical protein
MLKLITLKEGPPGVTPEGVMAALPGGARGFRGTAFWVGRVDWT